MRTVPHLVFAVALAGAFACDPPRPRPTTGPVSGEAQATKTDEAETPRPRRAPNLADAKKDRPTTLAVTNTSTGRPSPPPPEGYTLTSYPSPVGDLAAYVTGPTQDGARHPAVIYVLGGFSNGVGSTPWSPAPPKNDQSGRAFAEAGLVVMWPTRRGSHDNPGAREGFYGEVDDVLAARDWLSRQSYVDPERIYLVGHSTGGVVSMLAAASSDGAFRAVFAIGPVGDPSTYGPRAIPYDPKDDEERRLRAPIEWLHAIRDRTFVMEGDQAPRGPSEIDAMQQASENPKVSFMLVPGRDHFSVLLPATRRIAEAIVADTGDEVAIELTGEGLAK